MTRPVTLSEPHFSQHTLNKYASLMAQGNGYLGLRASHEEDYTRQTRGMYLAGLYHRAGKGEINELVNLPDVVGMEIAINGEVFSLSHEAWQRDAPRDKCALSCAINGIHAAFHYLKKNYISGSVMTVPTG